MFSFCFFNTFQPVLVLGTGAYVAYGYQKWNSAQVALKIKPGLKDDELLAIFSKIDTDKSGSIEKAELKAALEIAGMTVSEADLNAMIYAADEDHNSAISKDEWLNICKHIHHSNHASVSN